MTTLVACLSTGKGTWGLVSKLMQAQEWENIILISNSFGQEKFSSEKSFDMVIVEPQQSVAELLTAIQSGLEEKKSKMGLEVGVNIISGSGKEHMALLGALTKMGMGYRMVTLDPAGAVIDI